MKQFFAAATAALALGIAAPAFAGSMTPPAPADAMYNWSGFYIGANGGAGSSHSCWTDELLGGLVSFDQGCHDATGGVAGGQVGYRWQSSAWVLGLEAQGDWASLQGQNEGTLSPAITDRSRVNAFGALTAQAGFAAGNVLFYLKGGAAVTSNRFEHVSTPSNVVIDGADESRWGGIVGVGLEYGFAENWSFGVEYDHLFMPDTQSTFSPLPFIGPASVDSITQGVDVVTARLNYHFGG